MLVAAPCTAMCIETRRPTTTTSKCQVTSVPKRILAAQRLSPDGKFHNALRLPAGGGPLPPFTIPATPASAAASKDKDGHNAKSDARQAAARSPMPSQTRKRRRAGTLWRFSTSRTAPCAACTVTTMSRSAAAKHKVALASQSTSGTPSRQAAKRTSGWMAKSIQAMWTAAEQGHSMAKSSVPMTQDLPRSPTSRGITSVPAPRCPGL
mmetsp:Transcript_32591/g.73632  ORF Transcript_32591/g.73632 Transcript_32591/m.73632 type:complete len:208 (-) Transcript_32591:71-694(-)